MVLPIILLIVIPLFLGIAVVPPFEQPEEFNHDVILEPEEFDSDVISKEPEMNILYFILLGIWIAILMRILLQMKRGTFKITNKY